MNAEIQIYDDGIPRYTYSVDNCIYGGPDTRSSVFKAFDGQLGMPVALKITPKNQLLNEQPLHQEAITMANIPHPAIIKVLNYFEQDNQSVMVMEYLDPTTCPTLEKIIEGNLFDQPMSWSRITETVRMTTQLANVVDYMASLQRPLFHQDLKPSNIFYHLQTKEIKLTDFELSSAVLPYHNIPGHLVAGTAPYMSPETVTGAPGTLESEIHALAAIAFEMLTGKVLFGDDSELQNLLLIQLKIMGTPRRQQLEEKIKEVVPKYQNLDHSELFLTLFEKALRLNPEKRYETAAQFARALQEWAIRSFLNAIGYVSKS